MGKLGRTLAVPLAALITASELRAGELVLADQGNTRYVVAVTSGATQPERHAAKELSQFLEQVTGARFRVVDAGTHAGGPMLLVGAGAEAIERIGEGKLRGLGQEGLVIESVGESIVLAGGRPRGTLYAVYTFLEDTVGCRWYSPKVTAIPRRPTLAIHEQHVRRVPSLEYREPYCHSTLNADWALRNKVTVTALPLTHRGAATFYTRTSSIPSVGWCLRIPTSRNTPNGSVSSTVDASTSTASCV